RRLGDKAQLFDGRTGRGGADAFLAREGFPRASLRPRRRSRRRPLQDRSDDDRRKYIEACRRRGNAARRQRVLRERKNEGTEGQVRSLVARDGPDPMSRMREAIWNYRGSIILGLVVTYLLFAFMAYP